MRVTEKPNDLPFHLHPDHLQDLRKSGLSDDTIREAEMYSVPPVDIPRKLEGKFPKVGSLLAFPYLETDGFERVKLFPPQQTEKGTVKYYQKKGTPARLYFPPGVEAVLKDVSVPLYITEGEKKALKATQEGLFCIGPGGLWNWSDGREEKNLIPDFDLIEWKGRTVNIVPDNDWLNPDRHGEKKNLREAVYELAYRLIDRGAKVFIIELPQGPEKGLDDYLCSHSVEEFKALPKREVRKQTIEEMIEEASPENFKDILKRLEKESATERGIHINELAKKLKVRKSEIEKDLSKLTRHEAPDIEKLLESGANPQSNFSAQNFIDGILSFGVVLGDQKIIVKSDGEIVLTNGENFRFKRSALTAEAIKRFRNGENVSGSDLIERLKILFSDHVIFRDDRIPLLLAVWTIGTYLFKLFRFYGYLFINSPIKRCAKSLLLDILAHVCFNSTPRMVNPSESSTFREVHDNDATLIIDEVESLSDADREKRSEMISLLNAGFQRGAQVSRTETKNREFVVRYFNAYCPKILAGIKGIADTIEDRSFKIAMIRKTKSETVRRFNLRALESHIERIKDDIFIWALKYGGDVGEVYDSMLEVPGTGGFDDRLKDILEPLLSIASVIDTQANDSTLPTVKALLGLSKDIGKGREATEDLSGSIPAAVNLLKDMIDGADERFISAEDLFSRFQADEDLNFIQSKRGLAFFLAKLNLSRIRKKDGGTVVRGYQIRRAWVEDLEKRYA